MHLTLTRQIQDLGASLSRGEMEFTPSVLNFLEDWTLCHVQREDMALAHALNDQGH